MLHKGGTPPFHLDNIMFRFLMAIKKKILAVHPIATTEEKIRKSIKNRGPKIDEAYVFQAYKGTTRNEHKPKKPHDKEARDKAAQLLWSHLDTFQREQLVKDGYFYVKKGSVKFRVHSGWNYNLSARIPGMSDWLFLGCQIFDPIPPMGDLILAQKLLVESCAASLIPSEWHRYLDKPAKV